MDVATFLLVERNMLRKNIRYYGLFSTSRVANRSDQLTTYSQSGLTVFTELQKESLEMHIILITRCTSLRIPDSSLFLNSLQITGEAMPEEWVGSCSECQRGPCCPLFKNFVKIKIETEDPV